MLAKKLKKTPIVVQNCPGFLVNRILIPYVNEAVYCLQDGAGITEIDSIMTAFGMPLGPLALADEVGLDVGYKVAKILELGYGPRMTVAPAFDVLHNQQGLLGKKVGKGFYTHGKKKHVNTEVMTAIQIYTHINKTMISPKHILERLLLIMVNEAARCLEESVVASPALLDMAMIMGTGFPPFRGGLCRYVDEIGADKIVDQLSKLSDQLGERFIPAEGLKALSNSKTKYYSS